MKTIWKFPIEDERDLNLPLGARPLTVARQDGVPMLWLEVDTDLNPELRRVLIIGTGHPVPTGFNYVATFFSGPFVWHVYIQPSLADQHR